MARQTSKRKKGGAPKGRRAKRSHRLVADRSVPSEERDSRKRKLLKGPKEFRDLRRDQRK